MTENRPILGNSDNSWFLRFQLYDDISIYVYVYICRYEVIELYTL